MATQLTHSATSSQVEEVAIAFGAPPLGGFNAQVGLNTATAATVRLLLRTHADAGWVPTESVSLASGGQTQGNIAVYPPYTEAKWDVQSITGGSIRLTAVGLGI